VETKSAHGASNLAPKRMHFDLLTLIHISMLINLFSRAASIDCNPETVVIQLTLLFNVYIRFSSFLRPFCVWTFIILLEPFIYFTSKPSIIMIVTTSGFMWIKNSNQSISQPINYILRPKVPQFTFSNNAVKNQPICINFLRRFHIRILFACPPHLLNVVTVPWEIKKLFFNDWLSWPFAAAAEQVLRA